MTRSLNEKFKRSKQSRHRSYRSCYRLGRYVFTHGKRAKDKWRLRHALLPVFSLGYLYGLWLLSGATFALGAGEALALVCAIFYALYTTLNCHFVRKSELYLLVFVVFLTNALLSLVFALFQGSIVPNFDREFFIAIFITTVIGTIFCYFVQTIAQRYTTASKAALFFCLEPVSAGLIGYFFAGELLSIWQIFGAMLIIFGVIFSEFGKQICSKFKL